MEHTTKDALTKPAEYAASDLQEASAIHRVVKESKTVNTSAGENEEIKQNVAASDLEVRFTHIATFSSSLNFIGITRPIS